MEDTGRRTNELIEDALAGAEEALGATAPEEAGAAATGADIGRAGNVPEAGGETAAAPMADPAANGEVAAPADPAANGEVAAPVDPMAHGEVAAPADPMAHEAASEAGPTAGNEAAPVPTAEAVASPEDGAPSPEPATDDAEARHGQERSALDTARQVAQAGANSVTGGISAIRELSAAKRSHAQARDTLENLEAQTSELAAELAHRQEIEENFDAICEVQGAEANEAAAGLQKAKEAEAALSAQKSQLEGELSQLKDTNERHIAPWRELAESAKGALDDATKEHAEAKRALKNAQAQADDATASRDSRLAVAQRAVENAQGRLDRLQAQLAEMKRDSSTGTKELSEMQGGVAAALAQLENAREDVQRITTETSQGVENAQTHLYTQRKSLEEAESDLEAAKADEQKKREDYEQLRSQAEAAEKALADQIAQLAANLESNAQEQQGFQGRIDAAQAMLNEANDIHSHPEATQVLAARTAQSQSATNEQKQLVSALADAEKAVRQRTQRSRLIFFAIVAAVVLVVVLIVWLVLMPK